jgi:hypothetical protein
VALLAALVSPVAGCLGAAGHDASAQAGVNQYLAALRDDSPRAAYALLAEGVRKELPYERFAAQWQSSRIERSRQAAALRDGLRASDLGERAIVRYGDGTSVSLVREGGEWKLETAMVSRFRTPGPRDAVRVLAEALESRDFDALLRILTSRRREFLRRQVDALLDSLRKGPTQVIDQLGADRAELRWSADRVRYKLTLQREGGEWRVDDISIRPEPAPGP